MGGWEDESGFVKNSYVVCIIGMFLVVYYIL